MTKKHTYRNKNTPAKQPLLQPESQQSDKSPHHPHQTPFTHPASLPAMSLTADKVLQLQSSIGNQAVQRFLQTHPPDHQPVQRSPEGKQSPVKESFWHMTSQFVGAPPTFMNWGGGILCKSPVFSVAGTVAVSPNKTDGDLTVGFMQALVSYTGPKGRYWDADGNPYMTVFAPYASLPLKDGDSDTGGIFYGPEAQSVIDSTVVTVAMGDQPQTSLPWKTPDGKGSLQQIVGEQSFITWLVVHSDTTGKIYPLHWINWRVGWFSAVDESLPSGIPFDFGMITNYGEGQGPMPPIRSGAVANASGRPAQWEPWTG